MGQNFTFDDETIEAMKAYAEEVGLSLEEYMKIMVGNFEKLQPILVCKKCGAKHLIDDAGLSPHHDQENCRVCGAPDEEAFGI